MSRRCKYMYHIEKQLYRYKNIKNDYDSSANKQNSKSFKIKGNLLMIEMRQAPSLENILDNFLRLCQNFNPNHIFHKITFNR